MKPHSRSQNSASSSRLCLSYKSSANDCKDSSTKKSVTISKYLTSATNSEICAETSITTGERNLHEESPYKTCLTEIKSCGNTSINEENDFKTPKEKFKIFSNKVAKCQSKVASKKRSRKPKDNVKSQQLVFTKTVTGNLQGGDVNLEHLQMAIALSKSMQSHDKQDDNETTAARYPSTQQKVASLRETLKQFGFKTNADRIEVQNRKTLPEKKKKKSRYQFVTPVLLLRTEADREKLISDKVGLILAQNVYENADFSTFNLDHEVTSTYLQKHWRNDCKIFRTGEVSNDHEDFYVTSLNIPKSQVKCGKFLKDWKRIPGRETSPVPQGHTETKVLSPNYENPDDSSCKTASDVNKNQLNLSKPSTSGFKPCSDRSISPELFGSDDELSLEDLHKSPQHNSQSLLNLTPSLQHKPSNGVIPDECSESLLNITPKKKGPKSDRTSNSSKNKSSDLSDGDLLENEKGICTYESFTKEDYHLTQHYFDLTNSDSEENQSNNGSDEDTILEGVNPFGEMSMNGGFSLNKTKSGDDLDMVMVDESASPLKTGVSDALCLGQVHTTSDGTSLTSKTLDEELEKHKGEVFDLTQSSSDCSLSETEAPIQNTNDLSPNNSKDIIHGVVTSTTTPKNTSISDILQKVEEANLTADLEITNKTNRRTKSLNITDYVCNMLNEEQEFETKSNEFEANKSDDFETNEVFDLTQSSNGSTSSVVIKNRKERISTSSFDEMSPTKPKDDVNRTKFEKHNSFKSTTSDDVNLSQGSMCISDEELNYSSAYSTPFNNHQRKNEGIDLMEASCSNNYKVDIDCMPVDGSKDVTVNENRSLLQHPRIKDLSRESSPTKAKIRRSLFDERNNLDDSFNEVLGNSRLFTNLQASPPKSNSAENIQPEENCTTPKGEVIIKTTNVTPMADYDGMNTPKVAKELNKFGVKPMKRQRGVQMLKYIYESTHPLVGETMRRNNQVEEDEAIDEENRVIKRRKVAKSPPETDVKLNEQNNQKDKCNAEDAINRRKAVKSPRKRGRRKTDVEYDVELNEHEHNNEAIDEEDKVNKRKKAAKSPKKPKSPQTDDSDEFNISCNSNYLNEQHAGFAIAKTEQIEIVGNLVGETEDLIFERKQSRKIPSCQVPLHIAWHNLVSSLPELRKHILLYEPLQLEVVYMLLKEQGYKYHIQDLLTFLDKKCITIRTNQNSRQRRQQKKKSPVKKS